MRQALTSPKALEEILERNRSLYQDELGPTIDWLRKNNKSWREIIDSAPRPDGSDLGLTNK